MSILSRRILPLALGLALVLPASAWAQGRGHARGHDKAARAERPIVVRDARGLIMLQDGRRTLILDDDDFRRYPVRSDRGPSFCRSGAGHPVFGLDWCLEKGFGVGRPGSWFLRDNDVFLRDGTHVIVLRDRARDADRAFWGAVVGQLLAWVD